MLQIPVVQGWKDVVQGVIPEVSQHQPVGTGDLHPVNHGVELADPPIDFPVPAKWKVAVKGDGRRKARTWECLRRGRCRGGDGRRSGPP